MKWQLNLACVVALLRLFGWGQDLTPEQQQEVNKLISIQRNWGVKMNSPGVVLRFEETAREREGGNLKVTYALFATGLPVNHLYEWDSLPVSPRLRPIKHLGGISLKNGRAVCGGHNALECGDPEKPDDPIDFITYPVKGEPYRLAILSDDGAYKGFISVVPDPISAEDHGCKVTVTRLLPKFELALIEATGFPANSDVEMQSSSLGESHNLPGKADKDGAYTTAILPAVSGHETGTTTVSMVGKTCKPTVTLQWGSIN